MGSSEAFTPVVEMEADTGHPPPLERFVFTGSGSEYFRIWIVNLLLTILTLGIYSAWAKVRRTRYFYDSTRLANSSFDYHGNPIAILKGRLVAVAFIFAYNLAFNVSMTLGFTLMGVLVLLSPWLLWKSMQFKLYNSSYRGIRFGFRGTAGRAYLALLLFPLLALFSLFLAAPLAHQRLKQFQHGESRFGATHFSFHGTVGNFYKVYLIGLLIAITGVIIFGALLAMTLTGGYKSGAITPFSKAFYGMIAIFYICINAWMFLLFPIFLTMIQNLIWNKTRLGEHQFQSEMKWGRMAFIMITNIIGVVLTLGLFMPFAQIRSMKYRIESMSLLPASSLDNFIADTQAITSATGEGMADMLDFDLSL
ncbi:MAG: YjgN family protein [Pseudomonadota bacterium]